MGEGLPVQCQRRHRAGGVSASLRGKLRAQPLSLQLAVVRRIPHDHGILRTRTRKGRQLGTYAGADACVFPWIGLRWRMIRRAFEIRDDPMSLHAAFTRTIVGPLWAKWEKSSYLRHYHRLKKTQFLSADAIRARQWEDV